MYECYELCWTISICRCFFHCSHFVLHFSDLWFFCKCRCIVAGNELFVFSCLFTVTVHECIVPVNSLSTVNCRKVHCHWISYCYCMETIYSVLCHVHIIQEHQVSHASFTRYQLFLLQLTACCCFTSRREWALLSFQDVCLSGCLSFCDLQPTSTSDRSQPNLVCRYIPVLGPV